VWVCVRVYVCVYVWVCCACDRVWCQIQQQRTNQASRSISSLVQRWGLLVMCQSMLFLLGRCGVWLECPAVMQFISVAGMYSSASVELEVTSSDAGYQCGWNVPAVLQVISVAGMNQQ